MTPSHKRKRSLFKAGYNDTFKLLNHELEFVRAETPVIQLAIEDRYWRRDGQPYANAPTEHCGIIVSFRKPIRRGQELVKIPLSFPCDTYTRWEDNVRAVALSLEALRAVDRYGVTQNSEQYTGFKALPPPGPDHPSIATVDEAARFLHAIEPGCPVKDILHVRDNYRLVYRKVADKLHPDHGGQPELWAQLQAAKSLLDDWYASA